MASNVMAEIKRLQVESPLTETELGELMGCSPQSMHNALSSKARKDMYVGRAAEVLQFLGYGVALVPLGKKLPEGCIQIFSTEQKGTPQGIGSRGSQEILSA